MAKMPSRLWYATKRRESELMAGETKKHWQHTINLSYAGRAVHGDRGLGHFLMVVEALGTGGGAGARKQPTCIATKQTKKLLLCVQPLPTQPASAAGALFLAVVQHRCRDKAPRTNRISPSRCARSRTRFVPRMQSPNAHFTFLLYTIPHGRSTRCVDSRHELKHASSSLRRHESSQA